MKAHCEFCEKDPVFTWSDQTLTYVRHACGRHTARVAKLIFIDDVKDIRMNYVGPSDLDIA